MKFTSINSDMTDTPKLPSKASDTNITKTTNLPKQTISTLSSLNIGMPNVQPEINTPTTTIDTSKQKQSSNPSNRKDRAS